MEPYADFSQVERRAIVHTLIELIQIYQIDYS
jgi:hypothetical protein